MSLGNRRRSREEILEEIEFEDRSGSKNSMGHRRSRPGRSGSRHSQNSRSRQRSSGLREDSDEQNFRYKNKFNRRDYDGDSSLEKSAESPENFNRRGKYDEYGEDRFEKSGLLNARNKELKSKVRNLEKELFEKDKQLNDLKYSKNDLEI
jgi:hypothetical protein